MQLVLYKNKQLCIRTSGVASLGFGGMLSTFDRGFLAFFVSRFAALSWDVICRVTALMVLDVRGGFCFGMNS